METTASQSTKITVTLPRDLVGKLDRIATERGIGLSTLVRMLLFASLERPKP